MTITTETERDRLFVLEPLTFEYEVPEDPMDTLQCESCQ